MKDIIRAGASKVDITPPLGTIINGDFFNHYAWQIHDSLFTKALVLQYGEVTIGICIVDICAMRREFLDEVKKQVQQKTGIPPENILISSTHTHAAGSIESLLLGAADLPYRQKLTALIVQSIVQAFKNLANATIGFGAFDAPEYVLCRRYAMKEGYESRNPVTCELDKVKTNPFNAADQIVGPVAEMDTQFCYIAVKSEHDEWISLLANYSLHYVGDWENGTIGADYFGEFSNQLQSQLNADENFVGMLSNGTSGEANIWDFLNPGRFTTVSFEKSRLIGGGLAEKVVQSVNSIDWQTGISLSSQYTELPVNIRKPDAEALSAAKKIVSESIFEDLRNTDYATIKKIYAREQVLLNEFPDIINFPVQALRIGNIIIGSLGGEFFAETGLALKKQAIGYNYFTITLANDYVGYVCPEHEIERGGYETWRCRTSCLDTKAEQRIRTQLIALIGGL